VTSTLSTSISTRYGIDRVGTVYLIVYNYNNLTPLTSAQVKAEALAGASGSKVSVAVMAVAAGQINTSLVRMISGLASSTTYSLFWVAEDQFLNLQAAPVKILGTTKVCPDITLLTFFGNTGECVNLGAAGMFQASGLGAAPFGVIAGTTWTIDWGDGTAVWTYTSAVDGAIPPIQNHTYSNLTTCNYVGTWTVQNPCGKFLNGSVVFVVHGRDIPTDGDGRLRVEEISTGFLGFV
jgi:hypothetical protein